jgi:hypothetical protein
METSNKNLFSVKQIFQEHWKDYLKAYNAREIEKEEVEKMLSCNGLERGYFLFYCKPCNREILVPFGCNSRICSCCGKRYTDNWANMLSNKVMKGIIHRHLVFGIPDMLWNYMRESELRKVLMNTAHKTITKVFSNITKKDIEPGSIEAIHPFGRDIKFQPHVHSIVTEGGYTKDGKFVSIGNYISYDALHRKWQYEILNALRKYIPKNIIDEAFRKYPKGFCVYVRPEQIKSSKYLAKYIGRYIRHPAIANSRIIAYNGEAVKFYYEDNKGIIHYKIMLVYDFISAIIQHIPEKNERLVRYYGIYSRRKIRRTLENNKQSFIQRKLFAEDRKKRVVLCPICFQEAKFFAYCKKPPNESKEKLDYWIK